MNQIKVLRNIVEPWKELQKEILEIGEFLELLSGEDEKGTQQELKELQQMLEKIQHRNDELEIRSFLDEPEDPNNAYLEIHPGAGGTESCDWANMLLRMYLRWAEEHSFSAQIVDYLAGEEAGLKSVTVYIKGDYAYGMLKSETGVHRLVRISPFDANKRRHTSFASVFVTPEIEDDIEIEIRDEDIKLETFRASGHGGQHVNVTDSAVRLTHYPTGIVVSCQNERSQFRNKAMAFKILRSRLYTYYQEKRREEQESKVSKKEIAWGSQIRSYVMHPYNLVKDHRIGTETSNVKAIMDGEIDHFINDYLKQSKKRSS